STLIDDRILVRRSIRKLPFFLIDSALAVGFQADLPLFSILKGRCTMVSNFRSPSRCMVRFSVLSLTAAMVFLSATVYAQTSVSTGTILGTVTDDSDAVVTGAKDVITNKETDPVISTTTGSYGQYSTNSL